MLTIIQRVVVGLAVSSCGLWLGWALHQQLPWYGTLGGALLLLLPHAPILAVEFALMRTFGHDPEVPALSRTRLLGAWAGEVLSGLLVFGWLQPFRESRVCDLSGRPGVRGVLLVPGFFCTRGLWATWQRRLAAEGLSCAVVSLAPAFGRIDAYVPIIEDAVRALRRRTGASPVIVAHSMGGLAVRAWLAATASACNPASGDDPVRRVVTIGTPHRGTWLARFAFSSNGRQMRQHSSWLDALAAHESPACRSRFICFYSHADNIVFPASAATLPDADNRHLVGIAHLHMVFHPEVFATVRRLVIEAPSAASVG